MRYRLSEQVEQDLLGIWLYVAADTSVERADRLLEAIGDGLTYLQNIPASDGAVLSSGLAYVPSRLRPT